ncbi:MAG: TolC family protein [Panacagrimonas sp.]
MTAVLSGLLCAVPSVAKDAERAGRFSPDSGDGSHNAVRSGALSESPQSIDSSPTFNLQFADKLSAAPAAADDTGPVEPFPKVSEVPRGPSEIQLGPRPNTADPVESIDLSSALAKVWTENPQVRQAELALRATEYDVKGARLGYFPYFQVQASQGESGNRSAATLFLIQPLWNGGLTKAQIDGAKAGQLQALANLNNVRLQLGQRLLEAYFNFAQAADQEKQWNSYINSLKILLGSIERRAAQGVAPDADVQTALTRLKQAEAGIETARAGKLASRAQLANLLNEEPETVNWPGEQARLSEDEILILGREPPDVHPQRAAALAQIKQQEATSRAAKAALSPEVSLQHREQVQGVEFDPTNSATVLVMGFQSNNGLRGLRSYQADLERVEAAKAQLRAVDREISATIEIDRAQLKAARVQIEAQTAAAESSQALVDSFIRQYEVGRKSWLEVLNAQREANDTLLQVSALKRNFWFFNAKLSLDTMHWDKLSPIVPGETTRN